MARKVAPPKSRSARAAALEPLIEKLNSFSADNYWDLGRFLVDRIIPTALKEGIFGDQILKQMSDLPGFKFPYHMLKQCQMFYTYYPDVDQKPLPEAFYFELATKVDESRRRDTYEKQAIANRWTISDLQKKIRDDELARRQDEKTKYGFDLKERSLWSFDAPDPRFGKAGYKGRLPGQIIANALYYYTKPGAVVVDPMAGSGTTGDIIGSLQVFSDRTCRMYDIDPCDGRIGRANLLQTGIPEQTGTVDYVFIDPPSEFTPRGDDPGFSPATARVEAMGKFKSLLREGARILKQGGRISIIAEAVYGGFGVIDIPFEVTAAARELHLMQIGKVYLPRRAETAHQHVRESQGDVKEMGSECRELLTFEKE